MCRKKGTCIELGTDPKTWDKFGLLRTPKWMESELDLFVSAADDFFDGNRDSCLNKIEQIKSDEITYWFIEHGQMSGRHRKIVLKLLTPTSVDKALRDPIRSPKKVQDQVFKRDNYGCRYCGNRLVSQHFMRQFIRELDSPLFQRGETNLTTHGIIHLTWPVADHVIPWNLGGRTDLSNLVSSCATCNYGKDGNTIEEIGIENPFNRTPVSDNWCGLLDKLDKLKTRINARQQRAKAS